MAEFREPTFEQAALGVIVRQPQSALICVARFVGAPESSEQFASRRMQVAVVLQIEPVDDGEPRSRAVGFGDRDGSVQLRRSTSR